MQIAPGSIAPGGEVEILLNWRATDAIAPFGTVLNLTDPVSGTPYAQIDTLTPYNLSNAWLTVGQIAPVYYQFTTVPEIPVGAYPVTLSLHQPDSLVAQPIFRGADTNELDRSVLDYVAVAWQGEVGGEVVDATFDDGIQLQRAEILGEAEAGGTIIVRLYWQARHTPLENYTIFVHFLDSAGQYIVGSDAVPFEGRYPTRGWHPGDTIPSEQQLLLPADLPAGPT